MYQNVVYPDNDVDSRMALEQMRMGRSFPFISTLCLEFSGDPL